MKTKDEICKKLEKAGKEFRESLGAERFEAIRQVVADREKTASHYPLLKYAAMIMVLLGSVLFFRFLLIKNTSAVTRKSQPAPLVEKVDLTWDCEEDIDFLKNRISRLKRKVYFSGQRNENSTSFEYRCETIKKQTFKIKNAKQI